MKMNEKFAWSKVLKKFVMTFVATGGASAGVVEIFVNEVDTAVEALPVDLGLTDWQVYAVPLALALLRAGLNVWKHREKLNIDLSMFGGTLVLMLAAVFAGCASVPWQSTETVTITYPDGRVETVESTQFDPEGWARFLEGAEQLGEIAERLRSDDGEMSEAERQRLEQELRVRAVVTERIIEAIENGDGSRAEELMERLQEGIRSDGDE